MSELQSIWVPALFWDDHKDRCPSDFGDAGICTEMLDSRDGRRVLIRGTKEQIECLRSDAAFYCDRDGPDECPVSLKRSAKATLAAIAKAV